MKEETQKRINELRDLLRAEMHPSVVRVDISFAHGLTEINIQDRTPEDLKKAGISMRNLKGDFIK